jgi:hypothetical protein
MEKIDYTDVNEIDPLTGKKRKKKKSQDDEETVKSVPSVSDIKPSSFSDAAITRRMLRGS